MAMDALPTLLEEHAALVGAALPLAVIGQYLIGPGAALPAVRMVACGWLAGWRCRF